MEIKKLSCKKNRVFIIQVNLEPHKKHNSIDDAVHRWMLNEQNLSSQRFNMYQAITILSHPDEKYPSKFPLWVNISFIKETENDIYFQLEVSYRLRRPSVLQNQATGHPPFKVIL